jgi:hypothetical protein
VWYACVVGGVRGRVARERVSVLIALGLHAVAFVLATRVPRTPTSAAEPSRDVVELELELDVSLASQPPLPDTRTPTSPAHGPTASVDLPRAPVRAYVVPSTSEPPSTAPLGSSIVTDSPRATWTFSPTRPADPAEQLSMGTSRYRVPVAELTEVRDDGTANRAFATMNEHDLELGLGHGGPIRSAILEAVEADATTMGVALFDVTLDHAGAVRVDLVHATGASDPWTRLRESIARLVAAKAVRLPEAGRGLRVRVRVEARSKLADGREASSLGSGARATLGEAGTESVSMKEMPSVGVEHRAAVGSVRLSVSPAGGDLAGATNFGTDSAGPSAPMAAGVTPFTIGGTISPENIGSAPMRVVAARVVSETRL